MSRSVEAGDRVLREQESEWQDNQEEQEPRRLSTEPTRVIDRVPEYERRARVVGRQDRQDQHDRSSARHVPPHRHVVNDGKEVRTEDVDQRRDHQNDGELQEDPHRWVITVCVAAGVGRVVIRDCVVEEVRTAVGD